MSFNDIIVYVDGTEAAKSRMAFAVALAKEQDAHLIGIAFAPRALLPLYGADVGFADMSGVLQDVKLQGETALESFKACAAAAGVTRMTEVTTAATMGNRRMSALDLGAAVHDPCPDIGLLVVEELPREV